MQSVRGRILIVSFMFVEMWPLFSFWLSFPFLITIRSIFNYYCVSPKQEAVVKLRSDLNNVNRLISKLNANKNL